MPNGIVSKSQQKENLIVNKLSFCSHHYHHCLAYGMSYLLYAQIAGLVYKRKGVLLPLLGAWEELIGEYNLNNELMILSVARKQTICTKAN
jgi:hypothetical protein